MTRIIYEKHGIAGIYKGLTPNFGREVIGGAYYFGTYEALKSWKYPVKSDGTRDRVSFAYVILFGSLAGMAFWLPSYPWDIIKTRMQADDFEKGRNIVTVAKDIYGTSGWKGFFKGFTPCFARAIPANGAIFLGFEVAMRALQNF